MKFIAFWFNLFLAMVVPVLVFAHGDVHDRINLISAKLETQPANHELFIQRGKLLLLDGNPQAALSDLENALLIEPGNEEAMVLFAGALLKSGDDRKAVIVSESILRKNPKSNEALLIRARSLASCGRHADAVNAYTAAFKEIARPGPDLFIEQARAAALTKPHGHSDAVRCLDAGIKALGPLVSLQHEAIKFELASGEFDAAIKRIDELMAQSGRSEAWIVQRAEILESAGRFSESAQDYQAAFQMMQLRPDRIKRTEAFRTLYGQAERGLKRTGSMGAP